MEIPPNRCEEQDLPIAPLLSAPVFCRFVVIFIQNCAIFMSLRPNIIMNIFQNESNISYPVRQKKKGESIEMPAAGAAPCGLWLRELYKDDRLMIAPSAQIEPLLFPARRAIHKKRCPEKT